jgi:hypothetical protein
MKPAGAVHGLIVVAMVSAAFSQATPAASDSTPPPPSSTVEMITTFADYAVVRFSPAYFNQLNCGGKNQNDHIVIDWKDAPETKAMLSVALAAFSLQKKVGFGMNGCHPWKGGTPRATRVEMSN